ncbi:MAG: hypothetical protein ACM3SP_04515 [Chloroflexota bacterium]
MPFDARQIFANLAEKERIKGHHSPEGRAIRTLSRALSGWSSGNLSRRDVLVLCDQAVEDWLKARLKLSNWSVRTVPALLPDAVAHRWITPSESDQLFALHKRRAGGEETREISGSEVEAALEFCIELIDKHW